MEQLDRFIAILNTDFTSFESCDDDIVTLLWKSEFEHLSYIVVETVSESGTGKNLEAQISELVEEHLRDESLPSIASLVADKQIKPRKLKKADVDELSRLPELNSMELLTITDELVADARAQIARDDELLIQRILSILFQVFELESSKEDSEAVSAVVDRVYSSLLRLNRFVLASKILRRCSEFALGTRPCPPTAKAWATERIDKLSGEPSFREFEQSCLSAPPDRLEGLAEFVGQLPPSSHNRLMLLFRKTDRSEIRSALLPTIVRTKGATLEALSDLILSVPGTQAIEILRAMEAEGLAKNGSYIRRAIGHGEANVRRCVLEILGREDTREHKHAFIIALTDSDRSVRLTALHGVLRHRTPDAAKGLIAIIEGKSFGNFDLEEKRAFLMGFAISAGGAALPSLSEILKPTLFTSTREHLEKQVAAAWALSAVGSSAARKIASDLLEEKRLAVEIKHVLQQVLERWGKK